MASHELTPAGDESEPPETSTANQAIVSAFKQHPDREFRARELHELLGMPTDEAPANVTRDLTSTENGEGAVWPPRVTVLPRPVQRV